MTATLLVAVALMLYAHPMGDDFCNAADVRTHGIGGTVWRYYRHWGGRWGGHLFAAGFPAWFEITRGYGLGLFAILATLGLSLRFLLGSVPPLGQDPRRAWGLAALLLALHWTGMPAPGQSVYWLEGAWIYSFNVALSLALLGALLRLPPGMGSVRRTSSAVVLALSACVIAAFHELFGLILLAVLIAGAALARRWRDPRVPAWTAAAAGTLLGLVSVALSPGNAVREQTLTPEGHSVLGALGGAALMWVRVLDAPAVQPDAVGLATPLGWVVDAKLLAASVLLATLEPFRSWRPAWLEGDLRLWRLGVPVLALAILTGSFLAGGWARGSTLPLRAFNGLHLIFILAWLLAVFVWTRPAAGQLAAVPRALPALAAAVLALGLLVSGPTKLGLRDLARGRASAFDRAMEARYAEARRLRETGGSELVVSPVEPWPSSYFRNDVDRLSPELARCVASYLGVEAVRVAPGGP